MKRIAAAGFLLFFFVFACRTADQPPRRPGGLLPMSGSAAVNGVITSASVPLPGVTVTLMNASGAWRTVITDAQGRYTIAAVPPGNYTLRYELTGLSTTMRRVRVVETTQTVNADLKAAGVAEMITVTAEAPGVVYSTGMVSTIPAPPPPPVRGQPKSAAANYPAAPLVGGVVQGGFVSEPRLALADQYSPIAEHEFIDARKEATTTFSIDVDRASYANVRRFLTHNALPLADAVRLEEMVNYFTYTYPQPRSADPFSITAEVAGCPWDPTHRLMRIGIQGRNLDEWKMAPNNLVFLLDVSGSMMPPERLPLIKSAFHLLVDRLRAEDTVSIVVYAGAAGVVLPPTSGADKQTILTALDRLQAGGSTAGAAGIELAYKTAQDNFKRGGNNRVILATDGDFNVGINSVAELEKFVVEKRKTGVFLTTIGVGDDNYRDAVLETLADKGNGNYAYLDNVKEAEKVFQRELTGTLVTIAKDVKVQLEFDPARVASYRQLGYEDRALANKDFEDDTKDAGELGAGHSVTALYEIAPVANASNGDVAKIRLRYKQPDGETSRLIEASAIDTGTSAYAASADMQFASAVAEFAMLLRKSAHKGTATFADAIALARAARGADLDGTREEFLRMLDSARAMAGEAGTIARR
jgi:Ca-activated chloride channel family protein